MGVYAADGSWNISVVSGGGLTTGTGLYAADGSINVVVRTTEYGSYHKCGALLVTVRGSGGLGLWAPDGSLYISTSPYVFGSQNVTVVSGSLSGGGGGNNGNSVYPYLFF